MDGERPELNDAVHDILLGAGRVVAVHGDDGVTVAFDGTNSTMRYSPEGFFGSVRRLYWENPIVVIPQRREGLSALLRHIAHAIRVDRRVRESDTP